MDLGRGSHGFRPRSVLRCTMNLHLQPKQFLVLYNCIKNYENHCYDLDEEETLRTLRSLIETAIVDAFERIENQSTATAFDKWIKSEKNKIEGLENELEKIKESIPKDELVKKFTPVAKDKKPAGRPKKSR